MDPSPAVLEAVRRVWGFDALRPLQAEARAAGLDRRDALVVLPTGGGKSLCYQVPPLVAGRTDLVVSPLIALMKDQVDGLREIGYPAAALHGLMPASEIREVERGLLERRYRLVLTAPERLLQADFLNLVERAGVDAFAVDEAHCISQWGHDFRPEYRQLAALRDRFPGASIHAYTATATPRVRDDIVAQLHLRDPLVLVGTFDRPNLVYRILPQLDVDAQVRDALKRHEGEAAIVYCLSRKDTEGLAEALRDAGLRAAHYLAGMKADERRDVQDRFSAEEIDIVVATVAFGMGIDRANVRCVIHASLPKTVEHYQQETGRAGRDGLPAECVLFYSQADVIRLESLIRRSAEDSQKREEAEAHLPAQLELLREMRRFASAATCRHRMLSEYFGQPYEKPSCEACDVCLGEVEGLEDSTVTAQKILSCVARTGERFGVGHVVEVLAGSEAERVKQFRHDQLSTYGLLKDLPRKTVMSLVYQLLDQGVLDRTEGDRPVVKLNAAAWEVLRGQRMVRLVRPKRDLKRVAKAVEPGDPWAGVDRGLFERLREVRKEIAVEEKVPAYVVLHDRSLLDLARVRPTAPAMLEGLHGMGEKKRARFGERIVDAIAAYCRAHDLPHDLRA